MKKAATGPNLFMTNPISGMNRLAESEPRSQAGVKKALKGESGLPRHLNIL